MNASEFRQALEYPERFVGAMRPRRRNSDGRVGKSWLLSLAMIPLSIFLVMLYVA